MPDFSVELRIIGLVADEATIEGDGDNEKEAEEDDLEDKADDDESLAEFRCACCTRGLDAAACLYDVSIEMDSSGLRAMGICTYQPSVSGKQ